MALKKRSNQLKQKTNEKINPASHQKRSSKTMKAPVITDPLTKSGIFKAMADMTGSGKIKVSAFMEAFLMLIESHVKSRGPGKFIFPGLFKITVVKKEAKPARKGTNPFNGEAMMFKAKPAHKVVKIKALRQLKTGVL